MNQTLIHSFIDLTCKEWMEEASKHPKENNGHVWTGLKRLGRTPGRPYRALLIDNVIVGAVFNKKMRDPNWTKLELIDVFYKYRGKKLGRLLLEESKRICTTPYMTIDGANGAYKFYTRAGLLPWGKGKSGTHSVYAFKIGEPADYTDEIIESFVFRPKGGIQELDKCRKEKALLLDEFMV